MECATLALAHERTHETVSLPMQSVPLWWWRPCYQHLQRQALFTSANLYIHTYKPQTTPTCSDHGRAAMGIRMPVLMTAPAL
mmetsp:Transcript_36867/g.82002  ORF Transcript_36867/g.82002 Transcript_36867/m.82002 type:complete len:82 (+) Transcript_36867:1-246(+)